MRLLLKLFHRIEDTLLVAILLMMIALPVLSVVLRNFFGISLPWTDPVLENAVLWVALLGTMVASRKDQQIRIDIASHYLPKTAQRWLSVLIDLFTAAICLIVAGYSIHFLYAVEIEFGGKAFADVPAWVLETIIPIGFGIIGLRYLVLFGFNLLGKRPNFEDDGDKSLNEGGQA